MRRFVPVFLLNFLVVVAVPAYAESNAYLDIDAFSFFFAEGVEAGGTVPTISVPVELTGSGNGWTLRIEKGDLDLPPVNLPNGSSVKWTLTSDATGQIQFSGDTGAGSLAGAFLAASVETSRQASHDLSFTTGVSQSSVGTESVSREGVPLSRTTGYLQLVATGSDPPGSTHAIPFYVVISGRFVSSPEGFLAP